MSRTLESIASRWGLFLGTALAVLLSVAPPVAASTIVDFAASLPAGDYGSSTYTDPSGVVAKGFYFKVGTGWLGANLFVRNEANDHGLGVCNPDEVTCPGPPGGGDVNELDDDGNKELIGLTLPSGYKWVSVTVSSLDDNSKTDDAKWERGQLWGSLYDDPGMPFGLDPIWEFENDESEPTFVLPSSAATSPYLYFRPYDWLNEGTNHNNDFLVYKVEIERVTTPEPASLGLLALGLLGVGAIRRRRGRG